ncbi:cell division protein FtsQ/DivIB [Lentibacter algarum]|uniref:cell division protein FtsQ/DivIB n=1 Tax=Lentibacter algarum TaxID=576131 RepID=UPI001C09E568|nr:cell division protein FtsQ/DivIB [Lentibacter algarum]MBU2982870.1 cell division protein FtsQ/DivIB [Lentibacter algarum]
MQPLSKQPTTAKRIQKSDPAPSRWAYRFERLMLTPVFRKAMRIGLPFSVSLLLGLAYFADEARRESFNMALIDVRDDFQNRPEFMVNLMAVDGASTAIAEEIRAVVPLDFPLSSFELDLEDIRNNVAELAAVKKATVRIRTGGVLQIDVTERQPIAIWRTYEGIELVDNAGVAFRALPSRMSRPDLPLIAGEGAAKHLPEAMQLIRTATPLHKRMRGLARMGERRWDIVLDRGQRIMLPEKNPVQALQRVMALNSARDLLKRDVAAVDMRLAKRVTIRLNEDAVKQRWKARATEAEIQE